MYFDMISPVIIPPDRNGKLKRQLKKSPGLVSSWSFIQIVPLERIVF
jgi:hypothetical protein